MVQTPTDKYPYIQIETNDGGANLRRISLSSTISIDGDDGEKNNVSMVLDRL